MDSLTQIVLGASVGEAVLGKKIGNKAMLWGAIAGTIPDLDVFFRFFTDPLTATEMHRGFSHSIIFAILASPILGWLVSKLYRNKEASAKQWSWLFFGSIVTHPLLDAHTTWGTQLFWPLDYRVAYNNIFVVDPLYTLPFLVLVLAAMFYNRTSKTRRRLNHAGLIISSSYMVLTLVFKSIAHQKFQEAIQKENITCIELATKPTPLNSMLWYGQIQTHAGYRVGYYSLLDTKPITLSQEIPKNHHLLEPYKDQKVVKQLTKIAVGWYYIQPKDNHLIFTDIRFGQFGIDVNRSPFMWNYELIPQINKPMEAKRVDFKPQGKIAKAMGDLWTRIKGN